MARASDRIASWREESREAAQLVTNPMGRFRPGAMTNRPISWRPALMHDIMTGAKSIGEARGYYAKEFVDYRRKKPTPYPERLRLRPAMAARPIPTSACLPARI
jgi:hypothetical protein